MDDANEVVVVEDAKVVAGVVVLVAESVEKLALEDVVVSELELTAVVVTKLVVEEVVVEEAGVVTGDVVLVAEIVEKLALEGVVVSELEFVAVAVTKLVVEEVVEFAAVVVSKLVVEELVVEGAAVEDVVAGASSRGTAKSRTMVQYDSPRFSQTNGP